MEKTIQTPRGSLAVTYQAIVLMAVTEHQWRTDVSQAELRQIVTKHYPSARPYSSLQDELYTPGEFKFESKDFDNERVCWINVPLGVTEQDVKERLAKFPEAVIYRILADNVEQVLSQEQLHAIKSDQFAYTLDDARRSHITMLVNEKTGVPCPISATGEWLENTVSLKDNGRIAEILVPDAPFQYSSKGFSMTYKEDVDLRATVERVESAPAAETVNAQAVDPASTQAPL
jgi:hypothetical protein